MANRRISAASIYRPLAMVLASLLLVGTANTRAAGVAANAEQQPLPNLQPADVVRLQLTALAHNDQPTHDAGIATVYRFTSPGNREQNGPLAHFAQMLRRGYPEMLGNHAAKLQPTVIHDDTALQGVELIDSSGLTHRYVFVLSRQVDAPYAGCWMTDSVVASPDERDSQVL